MRRNFVLFTAETDFYRILNINSGKAADISGGYAGDGGNIQQYSYNGTDAHFSVSAGMTTEQ